MDAAKILAEHGLRQVNTVCYHSQQSAEKNLKGYLVANGVFAPLKTHDLHDLCDKCCDFDKSFNTLLPICDNLNPYGIRVKYPDEIEVDENEAGQAIADAEAIQAFEPIAAVRTALEAEHRKQYTVTQATATAKSKPPAG